MAYHRQGRYVPTATRRASQRLGSTVASAAGAAVGTAVLPGVGTAVGGLLGSLVGGGPPDGSSSDPRIVDLNNAYNQALQGNMGPNGYGYITTWINDQPPHPTYSNQYAQQLLSLLQQSGNYPGAPAGSASIVAQPATGNTSPGAPPETYAVTGTSSTGLGSFSSAELLLGAAALAGVVVLATRRRKSNPGRRRRRRR